MGNLGLKYIRQHRRQSGLRELRHLARLSVNQLARMIEVSPLTMYRLERGLIEPKLGYARRLAMALDCELDYLWPIDDHLDLARPRERSLAVLGRPRKAKYPLRSEHSDPGRAGSKGLTTFDPSFNR